MTATEEPLAATRENQLDHGTEGLKRELVRFGKRLYRLSYMPGTSGNLSVRLDERRLLATPTGMSKYALRSEDIVLVDMDGRQLDGMRKVTSEIGMHLAIYRERMDVRAVIHSHPPNCDGLCVRGTAAGQDVVPGGRDGPGNGPACTLCHDRHR